MNLMRSILFSAENENNHLMKDFEVEYAQKNVRCEQVFVHTLNLIWQLRIFREWKK